ncbi:DNA repair rad51-like protein, partial [Trifolium pratense]
GLRMQLQLLKLESEEHVEGPMLISSDEDGGEAAVGMLEGNALWRTEDSWESSYIIDVLSESAIIEARTDNVLEVWHSLESPVSLSVFEELEEKYNDRTTCSKSERRLLFDRINSGIVKIHEQSTNPQPWMVNAALSFGSKRINGLQDGLFQMLGSQGKVEDDVLGKLLIVESQWLKLRDDIDVIGREVERLILDDLVAEIVGI